MNSPSGRRLWGAGLLLALVLSGCEPSGRFLPPGGRPAPPPPAGHGVRVERHPVTRQLILRQSVLHDGQGGYVRDGLEQGFWPDGAPRSARVFHLDQPFGQWESWWPDGSLRSFQVHQQDGSPGVLRFYHPGGVLEAEGLALPSGAREGEWRFLRVDGSLERRGSFEGGLEQGDWEFFNPGGELRLRGRFEAGVRVGEWERFEPDPGGESP